MKKLGKMILVTSLATAIMVPSVGAQENSDLKKYEEYVVEYKNLFEKENANQIKVRKDKLSVLHQKSKDNKRVFEQEHKEHVIEFDNKKKKLEKDLANAKTELDKTKITYELKLLQANKGAAGQKLQSDYLLEESNIVADRRVIDTEVKFLDESKKWVNDIFNRVRVMFK